MTTQTKEAMSDNEIRIAIAEACGWSKVQHRDNGDIIGLPAKDYPKPCHIGGSNDWAFVPDYPNDLNAMHEAEKTLTGAECLKYAEEVNLATKCFKHITPVIMIFATARQRAEAFLKVKGLWK